MAQEKNISYAHPSKYRLVFPFFNFMSGNERAENVIINCSEVTLPGITMVSDKIETYYHDLKIPSPNVTWGDLVISYHVDELYENFQIMWNWFMFMKDPERIQMGNTAGMVDASVFIYSNNDNPKFEWKLKNVFPTALGQFAYSRKNVSDDDLEHSVSFSMDYYKIVRL